MKLNIEILKNETISCQYTDKRAYNNTKKQINLRLKFQQWSSEYSMSVSFIENISWGVMLLWELPPCNTKVSPHLWSLYHLPPPPPTPTPGCGTHLTQFKPIRSPFTETWHFELRDGSLGWGRWITLKATPSGKSHPSPKFHFFVLKPAHLDVF